MTDTRHSTNLPIRGVITQDVTYVTIEKRIFYSRSGVIAVHMNPDVAKTELMNLLGLRQEMFEGCNPECWWTTEFRGGTIISYRLWHISETGYQIEVHPLEP